MKRIFVIIWKRTAHNVHSARPSLSDSSLLFRFIVSCSSLLASKVFLSSHLVTVLLTQALKHSARTTTARKMHKLLLQYEKRRSEEKA